MYVIVCMYMWNVCVCVHTVISNLWVHWCHVMQQFVRQNPCFPYISDLDGVNMCQTIRVSTCFKPAF